MDRSFAASVAPTECSSLSLKLAAVASSSAAKGLGGLQAVSSAGAHRCDLALSATCACLSNLGVEANGQTRFGVLNRSELANG